MSEVEKIMGRPRKHSNGWSRKPVSFRLADPVKARIIAAADQNGRPFAEELERRIEASLELSDIRQIIREEICAALAPAPPVPVARPAPKVDLNALTRATEKLRDINEQLANLGNLSAALTGVIRSRPPETTH